MGFPGGASGKEPSCQCRMSLIPGSGRSPGGRHSNPLQYSCIESHGQRSPAGYGQLDCKELDMTEAT